MNIVGGMLITLGRKDKLTFQALIHHWSKRGESSFYSDKTLILASRGSYHSSMNIVLISPIVLPVRRCRPMLPSTSEARPSVSCTNKATTTCPHHTRCQVSFERNIFELVVEPAAYMFTTIG